MCRYRMQRRRQAIFDVFLRDKPVCPDVQTASLADMTEGLSGAEIAEVCRLAALDALRRTGFDGSPISIEQRGLENAIRQIQKNKNNLERRIGF